MLTKDEKKEFYGPCLPQRKQHYFGRNTGWAGGMGQPWIHKCVWYGKYNPKWKPKFWEEEKKIKMSKEKLKEEFERLGGEDALQLTRDIIEWYVDYLKECEPQAINAIKLYEEARDELPIDAEFMEAVKNVPVKKYVNKPTCK